MKKSHSRKLGLGLCLVLALGLGGLSVAEPTLKETMDGIVTRLYAELPPEELVSLGYEDALGLLTPAERRVLAAKYTHFDVNVPVVVSIIRHAEQQVVPFWLEEAGFAKTELTVSDTENWQYEVWQRRYDAGRVELGINGFGMHRCVYFVCVGPQEETDDLDITNLFPADEAVIEMKDGAWKYRDWDDLYVKDVPAALRGRRLLTSYRGRAREAHLVSAFRTTPYPSSPEPDQVVLTWNEDPKTTQTVQWRTNTSVRAGQVRYRAKGERDWRSVPASMSVIEDRLLINDRYTHHFTATLRGLEAGTAYAYTVGEAEGVTWHPESEFTTAPAGETPFSFICLADTHYKEESGTLLEAAFDHDPGIDFYMIAGDVVSTGLYRNEWDTLLHYYRGVSQRKPMVFALGNHDDQDGLGAALPLALFAFPENGPEGVEAERTFSFRYGNALFLVMDVGTSHQVQAQWMEEQLANTDATWKFALFHFPLYSVEEDYAAIRHDWGAVFDKHHLDMVFHGHVHYYLRSKPMKDGHPAALPSEGTIHTISIAQSSHAYPMPPAEHVAKRFNGTAVYQKVEIDGKRLVYGAYDADGKRHDELVIEK